MDVRTRSQKVIRCSMLATRHHARQRRRFSSSWRTIEPVEGAATSSPGIGAGRPGGRGRGPGRPPPAAPPPGPPRGRGAARPSPPAGDRRGDPGDVGPHPEALVADVIALREVEAPSRPREDERAEDRRDPDHLGGGDLAEPRDHLAEVPQGGDPGQEDGQDGDEQEDEDQPDLEVLGLLHGVVDHRRDRERYAQGDERDDGDVGDGSLAQAGREAEQRDPARGPTRAAEWTHRRGGEHDPERLPVAGEAGDGGLARGEGVALDLHVQEELEGDAHHGGPQEPEPQVRDDERPEDHLTRAHPEAREDYARTQYLAQRQRLRHVLVRHGRQVPARGRLGELFGRPADGAVRLETCPSPSVQFHDLFLLFQLYDSDLLPYNTTPLGQHLPSRSVSRRRTVDKGYPGRGVVRPGSPYSGEIG